MKNRLASLILVLTLLIGGITAFASSASAHGYVSSPGSRAYKGTSAGGKLNANIGSVQWEPQSIEAAKNTFIPGKIASAGISKFSPLDEQTSTRWHQSAIKSGNLPITWTLTAPHRTADWNYYITKKGWNPNKPLNISDFELIADINDNGKTPAKKVTHNVTVPTNRSGYNVILAVWNISDTSNAFYQVIDVNVAK